MARMASFDGSKDHASSAVGSAVKGFQTRRKLKLAEAGVEKNAQATCPRTTHPSTRHWHCPHPLAPSYFQALHSDFSTGTNRTLTATAVLRAQMALKGSRAAQSKALATTDASHERERQEHIRDLQSQIIRVTKEIEKLSADAGYLRVKDQKVRLEPHRACRRTEAA